MKLIKRIEGKKNSAKKFNSKNQRNANKAIIKNRRNI